MDRTKTATGLRRLWFAPENHFVFRIAARFPAHWPQLWTDRASHLSRSNRALLHHPRRERMDARPCPAILSHEHDFFCASLDHRTLSLHLLGIGLVSGSRRISFWGSFVVQGNWPRLAERGSAFRPTSVSLAIGDLSLEFRHRAVAKHASEQSWFDGCNPFTKRCGGGR